MHKRAGLLLLLGVSVAAVAGGSVGPLVPQRAVPAVQPVALVPVAAQAGLQASPAYSPIASDIARWTSLRQSDSLPFSAYASFLLGHRGWPG